MDNALVPIIYNSRNLEGLLDFCNMHQLMGIYNSRNLEGLLDKFGVKIDYKSTTVEI